MDAIEYFKGMRKRLCEDHLELLPKKSVGYQTTLREMSFYDAAIKALEQQPCEMTAEEYRQRMIQAFHNTDCDELIAMCVLPTEKEFEHLEWLLKNHYKKEPCDDAISRAEAIRVASGYCHWSNIPKELAKLPSVNTEKTGRWEWVQYDSNPNIGNWHCSECNRIVCGAITAANPVYAYKYCPNCGCRMVEPQESEDKE